MIKVKKRKRKEFARFFFFLLLSSLFVIFIVVAVPAILFREGISSGEQKFKDIAQILEKSSLSPGEKKKPIKQLLKRNTIVNDLLSELYPNNLPKFTYEDLNNLYCQERSDKSAEKKLANYQRFKDFKAFSITGDGDCFFNAISFLLTGEEKKLSDKLRLALIKILIDNENIPGISDWEDEGKPDSIITLLRQWAKVEEAEVEIGWSGGLNELKLLSNLLGREVIIINFDGNVSVREISWQPLSERKRDLNPLWLGYNNGNHYVALLPPSQGEIFNKLQKLEQFASFIDSDKKNSLAIHVGKKFLCDDCGNNDWWEEEWRFFEVFKQLVRQINIVSEKLSEEEWENFCKIAEFFWLLHLSPDEYEKLPEEKKKRAQKMVDQEISGDNSWNFSKSFIFALSERFFEIGENIFSLDLRKEYKD